MPQIGDHIHAAIVQGPYEDAAHGTPTRPLQILSRVPVNYATLEPLNHVHVNGQCVKNRWDDLRDCQYQPYDPSMSVDQVDEWLREA